MGTHFTGLTLIGDQEFWFGQWAGQGSRPETWTVVWVEDVDAFHARVIGAGVAAEALQDKDFDRRRWLGRSPLARRAVESQI